MALCEHMLKCVFDVFMRAHAEVCIYVIGKCWKNFDDEFGKCWKNFDDEFGKCWKNFDDEHDFEIDENDEDESS